LQKIKFLIITLILILPAYANDDEVIEMIDILENYEILKDENFENLIADGENDLESKKDKNDE
tara:strand:- start:264 stop:452 length:189 start_codon:yes stop_codon:yes gene_type:complete